MKSYDMPRKIVNLTKLFILKAVVMTVGRLSRIINVSSDGSAISAVHFILSLHKPMRNLDFNGSITYRLTHVNAYADGIVLTDRNTSLIQVFQSLETRRYKRA